MRSLSALLILAVVVALGSNPVHAHPQYQKAFLKKYLTDHPDADYVKMVKREAKCFVCHQGKKKENCNPYGLEFMELLTKDDVKNTEKIDAALDTVAKRPSVPGDETSPTYADLIAKSQLPGGDLEACKKDPPGTESGDGDDEEEQEDDGDEEEEDEDEDEGEGEDEPSDK